MTEGRSNILAAIDRQLRLGALPPAGRLEHPGAPPRAAGSGDLVARFEAEASAVAVGVHRVRGDIAAIAAVLELLRSHQAATVLAWDSEWLNCPGLGDAIAGSGITLEPCWLPSDPNARRERLAALDPVPVGLTGAVAGLADTGTIAVISGPGCGRMASLLPPVHIAVLRAEQIVPSLGDFLIGRPDAAEAGSNLVFITGPSRTGDIEMTLSRGVHGPGIVHVVVIES
jgi:L-lactate dehydrogenase complex protein LldG